MDSMDIKVDFPLNNSSQVCGIPHRVPRYPRQGGTSIASLPQNEMTKRLLSFRTKPVCAEPDYAKRFVFTQRSALQHAGVQVVRFGEGRRSVVKNPFGNTFMIHRTNCMSR